jgi:hypothetical protein
MTQQYARFVGSAAMLEPLRSTLEAACADRGGLGSIAPLGVPRKVRDSCDKFLIRDGAGRRMAVLSVSPADRPRTTDIAAQRTRDAHDALDERLRGTVLLPWHVGQCDDGVGYSIAQYHQPLSAWRPRRAIERRLLAPRVQRWLRAVVQQTVRPARQRELQEDFVAPLVALSDHAAVSPQMRERARRELRALDGGHWQARTTLAHYDLWDENFLYAPGSEHGFVVIDWGGARTGGHPLYDLLRLSMASATSDETVLEQMRQHCRLLDCPLEHAAGHTLAALGHLLLNLGDWPLERFARTAQQTFDKHCAIEQCWRARERVPVRLPHRHAWGMAAEAAPLLDGLDLADYDALMNAAVGTPLKTKPGLAIYRLSEPHSGQVLFLKRATERPTGALWRLFARWLRGRPMHSEPYHVHLAEQTLRAHGFNPMPVLAWGERRAWGWLPTQGFMVARGVPGDSLDELFTQGSTTLRRRVLGMVGRLMARMHERGFNVTLRLYDLFASRDAMQSDAWRHIEPAIIDLDFKGQLLRAEGFNHDKAIRASAHCAYLMLRTGRRFGPGEAAAWLRAYCRQLRSAGLPVPHRLAQRLRRCLQLELRAHHANKELAAMFPATPTPTRHAARASALAPWGHGGRRAVGVPGLRPPASV